jgi:hypothetical protein
VTAHRVTYEGPSALAVQVATLLADAEGVDLTSAEKQDPAGGSEEATVLALTVEATTEAVGAAVGRIGEGLPAGARLSVEDPV